MFTFHIENREPLEPLTKNGPKLDKYKSIVSRFSLFVAYESVVRTITFQKATMWDASIFVCECLNLHIYFLIFQ